VFLTHGSLRIEETHTQPCKVSPEEANSTRN